MELRRRNMMSLPSASGGDTPVDGIVNEYPSATSIPNHVYNSSNTEFYARITILSLYTGTSSNCILFGGYNGELNIGMASSKIVYRQGANTVFLETGTLSIGDVVEISLVGKTLEFIVNNVSAGSTIVERDEVANNAWFGIFRKATSITAFEDYTYVKYSMNEMYYKENGVYNFHLLPYIDSNGIPYIYDEIAKTKNYPKIGAPFNYILDGVEHSTLKEIIIPQQNALIQQAKDNLSNEYSLLNCIVSVGAGRIDVGLPATTEMLVRYKAYVPIATGNAIIGDTTTSDNNDYRNFNYHNGCYFDIKNKRISGANLMPSGNTFDFMLGDFFVYDVDSLNNVLNSTPVVTDSASPFVGSSNLRILRDNNNNGSKIYHFVITDKKANHIRVMIPCIKNNTSEYGMYDSVTETFFTAEQGSFTGE